MKRVERAYVATIMLFGLGLIGSAARAAMSADGSSSRPPPPLRVAADTFYTPLHLDKGQRVTFLLVNGQSRELQLLECGVDMRNGDDPRRTQWTLWAEVLIDGHPFRLLYSPFDMKALYRPKVINGMRIALDGVRELAAVLFPDRNDKNRQKGQTQPPADVRLWVNDATLPLLPDAAPWFDLSQHLRKTPEDMRPQDFWLRHDRDIHPAHAAPDINLKTGFLGYWTYGTHIGLDLHLRVGTRLFCVVNDGVPQARCDTRQSSGPYFPDQLYYAVRRPNGDVWWFLNAHCRERVAPLDSPMKAGDLFAISGTERAGAPHAHTEVHLLRADGTRFYLNPWPVMWQGFENARIAAGFPQARIAPLAPQNSHTPIEFRAETNTPTADQELSYEWFFDDGTRANGPRVRKTFAQDGLHQAILIVRNKQGFDLDEQFVTVGTAQDGGRITLFREVTAFPRLPVAGQTVRFSVSAADNASNASSSLKYEWDFGDGSKGEGQSVEHTYANAGWYYVIVRISNPITKTSRLDWYGLDVQPPAHRARP